MLKVSARNFPLSFPLFQTKLLSSSLSFQDTFLSLDPLMTSPKPL